MSDKPAGCFVDDPAEEDHGEEEDALENDGDTPGVGGDVRGEAIVDPVDKEDAEVEGRELHADVWSGLVLAQRSSRGNRRIVMSIQRPLVALGANSACKTGTVEFVMPNPTPATILATII